MTTFLRLLANKDKADNLLASCTALRAGMEDARVFQVAPEVFRVVPGAPFAYWATEKIFQLFQQLPAYRDSGRTVRTTNPTTDDFRYARAWWEPSTGMGSRWRSWNKGGGFSPFYRDIDAVVDWDEQRSTYRGYTGTIYRPDIRPANLEYFSLPGLTWGYRGSRLCVQAMPSGTVISTRGNGIYAEKDQLLFDLGLLNSLMPDYLIKLTLGRNDHPQFDIGDINTIPVPVVPSGKFQQLTACARRGWLLKRALDTVEETSHAFLLPAALRARLGDYNPPAIEAELACIQTEIDAIAFGLYGFSDADCATVQSSKSTAVNGEIEGNASCDDNSDEDDRAIPIDQSAGLLSWAMGVAFGRFDWRLATGERAAPPDPEPFDPLPAQSPGMLMPGSAPFHPHAGILVDDPGHLHDLPRLLEEVLARVNVSVPPDVRRWLQRECPDTHWKRYSKSRRKAPIYWPLSVASGSYTLWLYYPTLNDQTLFTAVNDFVDPKLQDVRNELGVLTGKGPNRSRQEETQLEALASLEHELGDLRDTLLEIAPYYRPNHNDGVQITAAPLWKLFRHKPWQKLLKETWTTLEKGDYDWAYLAMNYWPDRVRDKCVTEKSLAIAHSLEHLCIEPESKPAKHRGRKKAGSTE